VSPPGVKLLGLTPGHYTTIKKNVKGKSLTIRKKGGFPIAPLNPFGQKMLRMSRGNPWQVRKKGLSDRPLKPLRQKKLRLLRENPWQARKRWLSDRPGPSVKYVEN
jgi:hypothetical protein